MKKEDLICEILSNIKEVTVCQGEYRNSFDFENDDVYWFWNGFDTDIKYRIFGKLKKDEVFNMSLGDAYFYINEKPCCCRIPQINHPKVGERDNYEMIIIIEVNRLNFNKGSIISDFHTFFQKYDGPIFEDVKEIEDRFDILDL